MVVLYFSPERLPRSMTKAEWRECHRWKRVCERKLRADLEHRIANTLVFGTSHPEVALDLADQIANPPLMLSPWDAPFRPGEVPLKR